MYLFRIFGIFLLAIPVIEIYFLVRIGAVFGVLPTAILLVTTAIFGIGLLRSQGLSTLRRLQNALSRQEMPAQEVIEGLLLLISGAFLLIPGFLTDVLALYLLIPFTRKRFVKYLIDYQLNVRDMTRGTKIRHPNSNKGVTIEGTFKRVD